MPDAMNLALEGMVSGIARLSGIDARKQAGSQIKVCCILALCASALIGVNAQDAIADSDITGRWEVTTTYPGGSYVSGLDPTVQQDKVTGRSGWLVPDWADCELVHELIHALVRLPRDIRYSPKS